MNLRPPSVPLVTHDPYFSIWSATDILTDSAPVHWTGAGRGTAGMVCIDGKNYRCIGPRPADIPPMEQLSLEVTPTRTIYRFRAAGIELSLTFCSPLLPYDLEIMSRPVTYVTFSIRSADKKPHAVSVYFECTADWATNTADEEVTWSRFRLEGMTALCTGTLEQPVLKKAGDNIRCNWGYIYLAVPEGPGTDTALGDALDTRAQFIEHHRLPLYDNLRMPCRVADSWPAMACMFNAGKIGAGAVERHLLLAHDDLYSLEYFKRRLRPWWRRNGMQACGLLRTAEKEYGKIMKACAAFDREIMNDLHKAGGEKYAQLCALAFRQCIAAHKLAADYDGSPVFFSKENFSNGCINTVDVTYPSAPFFLLFNPRLLAAQVVPVLDYAASPRWKFPYAPHDLGTYPLANGQVYGGGERTDYNQMPVEECGNMLILVAALVKTTNDISYAKQRWNILCTWADYLLKKGLDPENQLCTDDFAGHLAHNANLGIKAIVGLGGFAFLAQKLGERGIAKKYRAAAERMVRDWLRMTGDGDHYRLVYDKPGTWSQKYNLVWDRLLGLNLFPAAVAEKEIAYYKTRLDRYGLPLDGRKPYAKLDWSVWSATMAKKGEDFRALVDPLYVWAHETPTRVPLTDWFWTTDGKQAGFQARSVVGGIFIKLLADKAVWKKWVNRSK